MPQDYAFPGPYWWGAANPDYVTHSETGFRPHWSASKYGENRTNRKTLGSPQEMFCAQIVKIHRQALTKSKQSLCMAFAFPACRRTAETIRNIETRICAEPGIWKPVVSAPRSYQNANEARQPADKDQYYEKSIFSLIYE